MGASHQTGRTGVIAYLMKMSALITPEAALSTESAYAAVRLEPTSPPLLDEGMICCVIASPLSESRALIHSCRVLRT